MGEFRAATTDSRHYPQLREIAAAAAAAVAAARKGLHEPPRAVEADCLANRIVQPNNYCLPVTRDCIALQLQHVAASAPALLVARPPPPHEFFACICIHLRQFARWQSDLREGMRVTKSAVAVAAAAAVVAAAVCSISERSDFSFQ